MIDAHHPEFVNLCQCRKCTGKDKTVALLVVLWAATLITGLVLGVGLGLGRGCP